MSKILKLKLKTLANKCIIVEIEEDEKVKDLKKVLHEVYRYYMKPENQQIMYNGRVLKDEQYLSKYNIDDRKYLVVMLKSRGFPDSLNKLSSSALTKRISFAKLITNRGFQQALQASRSDPKGIKCILSKINGQNVDLARYVSLHKFTFLKLLIENVLSSEEKTEIDMLVAFGRSRKDAILEFFGVFNKNAKYSKIQNKSRHTNC